MKWLEENELCFRFEENIYKAEGGDDSDGEESDESGKGRKRGERKGDRKRRREDEEYRPDELAFNKSEYFKVQLFALSDSSGRRTFSENL